MSIAVATRYANALVDAVLASKEEIEPRAVAAQLGAIADMIRDSADLRNVLNSPAIPVEKKNAVMGKLAEAAGMGKLARNFVSIVVRKRRANLFSQIRVAFERTLDERTGVLEAKIASASALSEASQQALEAQLSRLTGKKVRATYSINPDLLGGVTARIGSTVYDGSVRGQLESLRRKLTASA
jgi:F-type H+-transporting ATPase subunit delta